MQLTPATNTNGIGTADRAQGSRHAHLWDPIATFGRARWWIWGLLAMLTWLAYGPAYLETMQPDDRRLVDFFQDWASARNHFEGLPVYERHEVTIPRYLGYEAKIDIPRNAHPPTSVLLVLPFACLDFPTALLTWNTLSAAPMR